MEKLVEPSAVRKIVILGDSNVGKTSIISWTIHGNLSITAQGATVGAQEYH